MTLFWASVQADHPPALRRQVGQFSKYTFARRSDRPTHADTERLLGVHNAAMEAGTDGTDAVHKTPPPRRDGKSRHNLRRKAAMRARVLEWTHSHIWVSRAERFLNGRDLFRSCNLTVVQTAGHSNFPVGQFVRRATTVKAG